MSHYVLYHGHKEAYPVPRFRFYEHFHLDIAGDILMMEEEEASDDIHVIATEKNWSVWDDPLFWYEQTI